MTNVYQYTLRLSYGAAVSGKTHDMLQFPQVFYPTPISTGLLFILVFWTLSLRLQGGNN